jgi:hypothetical protein
MYWVCLTLLHWLSRNRYSEHTVRCLSICWGRVGQSLSVLSLFCVGVGSCAIALLRQARPGGSGARGPLGCLRPPRSFESPNLRFICSCCFEMVASPGSAVWMGRATIVEQFVLIFWIYDFNGSRNEWVTAWAQTFLAGLPSCCPSSTTGCYAGAYLGTVLYIVVCFTWFLLIPWLLLLANPSVSAPQTCYYHMWHNGYLVLHCTCYCGRLKFETIWIGLRCLLFCLSPSAIVGLTHWHEQASCPQPTHHVAFR